MKFSHRKKASPPQWTLDFKATVEVPLEIVDIDFRTESVQLRVADEEIVAHKDDIIYFTAPYEHKRK